MKEAVEKRAVLKKEVPESIINGENAVSVSNIGKLKSPGSRVRRMA